jgi:FkbM family methyltransferase
MKQLIKSLARRAGYEIRRADARGTMASALERVARRHPVATVIDVGASDGRWSALARRVYPEAAFLLIEAQAHAHAAALRRFAATSPTIHTVLAAAGDAEGMVHFDASDPFSGVASKTPTGGHDIVIPMTTIDAEVRRLGLPGPYLLKLDTHGFEVPILAGAERTLAQTAVAIIESYNFELMPGALRFHQLCDFMEEQGLRVADLVDVMRRPTDEALWQFDLFFIPANSEQFQSSSYD